MGTIRRSVLLAAVMSAITFAGSSNVAAKAAADMKAELAAKNIDINGLVAKRKGNNAHSRCNAAAAKRASVKRRNIAKNPRSTHGRKRHA